MTGLTILIDLDGLPAFQGFFVYGQNSIYPHRPSRKQASIP
jgi:hypothetical protein